MTEQPCVQVSLGPVFDVDVEGDWELSASQRFNRGGAKVCSRGICASRTVIFCYIKMC